jgi:hypothetical protein
VREGKRMSDVVIEVVNLILDCKSIEEISSLTGVSMADVMNIGLANNLYE